jgi:hypothetical protein
MTGRVIAAANFCAFSAMWLAGRIFSMFVQDILPSRALAGLGLFSLGVAAVLVLILLRLRQTGQINVQGEIR